MHCASTVMLFDIFKEDNKTGTAGIDIQYLWPYSFSGPRATCIYLVSTRGIFAL